MKCNILSDKEIKNAKPRGKAYKLGDGDGLFLFVTPQGRRHRRMKYHFEKKERLLSIGSYPEISLKEARDRKFEARKQLANGIDPITAIREIKRQKAIDNANSFEHIAREWHEKKSSSWTPYYITLLCHQLNPSAIFVDGAYLLKCEEKAGKYEKIGEVCRELKELAMCCTAPVIASWQLNRESKKSKAIGIEHIAGADEIGQLSSIVLGLCEDETISAANKRKIKILKGAGQASRVNFIRIGVSRL